LLSDDEMDLRGPLRRGATDDDLERMIQQAIESKPECHKLTLGNTARNRSMCQIGG
jgi:cyclic pyranopterin phosphate synthase